MAAVRQGHSGSLPTRSAPLSVPETPSPRRFPLRARSLALLLLLVLSLSVLLARACTRYLTLLTPVLGVAVQPHWVLVRGTKPVALATLAIPDARHNAFRAASLAEKAAYATARGYWLVACNVSLDAARPPVWSKLRLLAAVLEQVAPTVLWLDLDTVVWDRHRGIEHLLAGWPESDLHAQHDFHRFSVYFNAGVMLLRRSEWTSWLLAAAYDTRRTMLLSRLLYTMQEQDALNLAARRSMQRPAGTRGRADGWKAKVHAYPRLWAFDHDAYEEDGATPQADVLALHFPNCRDGRCGDDFRRMAQAALERGAEERAPAAQGELRRGWALDMPLKAGWLARERRRR
jgi:hypothetical protein